MKSLAFVVFLLALHVPASAGVDCSPNMPTLLPEIADGATASFEQMHESRVSVVAFVEAHARYSGPDCHQSRKDLLVNYSVTQATKAAEAFNRQLEAWLGVAENAEFNKSVAVSAGALAAL